MYISLSLFLSLSLSPPFLSLSLSVCRFLLSLSDCHHCMVIDDQLNILPISSHMLSIKPTPPNHQVTTVILQYIILLYWMYMYMWCVWSINVYIF